MPGPDDRPDLAVTDGAAAGGEPTPASLLEPVSDIIKRVSAEVIEPRFRNLADAQIDEKAPGDLVTVADREAEVQLAAAFADLLPGVAVVGEEAVAADASVLQRLLDDDWVWIIDPIDGTKNFVQGSPDFAVMVALARRGVPQAAWIWQPRHGVELRASAGGGVQRNGAPFEASLRAAAPEAIDGIVKVSSAPTVLRDQIRANSSALGAVHRGRGCAGVEYTDICLGHDDFLVYWKAYPWDHAPGVLLVQELGGQVRFLDGSPYRTGPGRTGILSAGSADVWRTVHRTLRADTSFEKPAT